MPPQRPNTTPERDTDDNSLYTQAELAGEADALGTTSYEIAGIFREAGKDRMSESAFSAALDAWRGKGT